MEIELRAKVYDGPKLVRRLQRQKGVSYCGEKKEEDLYFRHSADRQRLLVLRIRETPTSSMLTFKMKARGRDTAWADVDALLTDPRGLKKILRASKYEEVVRIRKQRFQFQYKTFEVNVDHIARLGWFIEIEGRGNVHQRKRIEKRLRVALNNFGVQEDIIHEGYVPLLLRKFKKY